MSDFSLLRAARWFLHSGIQSPSGGFARFYRSEIQKNMPLSTEISGYAASALVFLYRKTNASEYLDAARSAARFLTDQAWEPSLQIFPYEYPSPTAESRHLAYFFDSGIIVRGLLDVWRETKEDRFLEIATAAAHGMSAFRGDGDYHPILTLPDRKPLPRSVRWSTAPGCYQTKSALAWWELAAITGDEKLRLQYLDLIEAGMVSSRDFLNGALADGNDRTKIMDRLHALCYFLEALAPLLDRADCLNAYGYSLAEAAHFLRELEPQFVRSDVYAQVLRARLQARHAIPVDVAAARGEADALAGFQADSPDMRIDGGFYFGKRGSELSPHVNPVSTTFAIQALEMWRAFGAGEFETCLQASI